MALPTFPAYMKPLRDGYKVQRSGNVLRTEMEGPIPKERPVNSKAIRRVSITFAVDSKADYNAFIAWLDTSPMARGVGWFTWTDPYDAVAKRAKIVKGIDGITETPLNTALTMWNLSMTLEMLA